MATGDSNPIDEQDHTNATAANPIAQAQDDNVPRKARTIICAVLLCAACAEFVARGTSRAPGNSADFAVFYTDSRAWLEGANPYDVEDLRRVARESGGAPDASLKNSAYPPATFIVLAPVSVLRWPAAKIAWTAINTAAVLVVALGLVRLAGLSFAQPAGMLLAAGTLALAPMHTSVHTGQLTPVLLACIVMACLLDGKRRVWLGGALLAIAAALKPQVGLLFVGFEFIRGRFRVALTAIVFTALLFAAAIGWLAVNDVDWVASWHDNYHAFMHGGSGDPGPINPGRHQLLNLHYPLRTFLPAGPAIQVITLSFVGAVGIVGLIPLMKLRGRSAELLGLGLFGVLSLLAVYQRYYGAVLLIFPLAWAVVELHSGRARTLPVISLALTAVFLAPTATVLKIAADKGYVPAAVADSQWWQGLVMPHQVYALAAMAVVLVAAAWQARRRNRVTAATCGN